MEFKNYDQWINKVQALFSLFAEDEIQWELESGTQSYVTGLNLHGTLDRDGNADSNRSEGEKSSWDKLFPVISVKAML